MTFREATTREATTVNAPANAGSTQVVWNERRSVGRPSTVAAFGPQIGEWLRTEPMLSGAEVLRRARLVGYRGGKSALYELVRRLRPTTNGTTTNGN